MGYNSTRFLVAQFVNGSVCFAQLGVGTSEMVSEIFHTCALVAVTDPAMDIRSKNIVVTNHNMTNLDNLHLAVWFTWELNDLA